MKRNKGRGKERIRKDREEKTLKNKKKDREKGKEKG